MAEKPKCKAIKAGGGRCSLPARAGQEYCWSHSRETAEQRREYARAGGKARSRRSPDELEMIKREIRGIALGVFRGEIDKATGAVLGQLYNTQLRAIEVQRKLDHQRELEEQVEELKERVQQIKAARAGTWRT